MQCEVQISGTTVRLIPELVARYDRRLPRYTSYPPVPAWASPLASGERKGVLGKLADREISLYVHFPFCRTRCAFCGCSAIATDDRALIDYYVEALIAEMRMAVDAIGMRSVRVRSLHIGGGSPDYIPERALRWIIEEARDGFGLIENAEVSIEADPGRLRLRDIVNLSSMSVNRLSLGVQDVDARVREAIGRTTDVDRLNELVGAARRCGFGGVAIDLVYGLPHQTVDSFAHTVDCIVAVRPDRIALFNFAYLPQMFLHQESIARSALPDAFGKLTIFARAVERLERAGYRWIGLDHFALHSAPLAQAFEEGTLARTFQGYVSGDGRDVVGLGMTAISRIGDSFVQNLKGLDEYLAAVGNGTLESVRAHQMNDDDRWRGDAIEQLLCYAMLDVRGMRSCWGADVSAGLGKVMDDARAMERDGLLVIDAECWRVTPLGRLFLRNIAHLFDARRDAGTYSRSI